MTIPVSAPAACATEIPAPPRADARPVRASSRPTGQLGEQEGENRWKGGRKESTERESQQDYVYVLVGQTRFSSFEKLRLEKN